MDHSREGRRLTLKGQGSVLGRPYGARVSSMPAAGSGRHLAALVAASLAGFVAVGVAHGASSSQSAYLAPAAACARADDPAAPSSVQRRAVACLVNWARKRDRRSSLRQPASLRRAAVLKGRGVVSCNAFSHTPCGSDPAAALRAAGYRYSSFGENLFVGPWGEVSARDVVAAWLASPLHRANILRAGFRDLGVTFVHAPRLDAGGDAVVWVAAFASPR